ncbi:long-chain-fatty-acid--CoA ligase [Pollutimonas harenae]|uniref:Long-chain-fatty-acid--CoA ligase n=1 Tax=Pollutimonas harenae TaxID=657015 RepID=A0A853H254_9BURK|nr:long-chain-fatty-acid--CoA ligase [Pollutimonas harenae]NYT86362.1 long-chain-fatty-acid--CoA ligase [Pollutimonas harenae]TEA69880.1 long-chain-fatty-acid--CoA ligase [Pollutimonas harenae]
MAVLGNMMNRPLLVSSILTHAVNNNPRQLIVTAMGNGVIHRYTYTEFAQRARQLAIRLLAQGIQAGDRVGTLAWNTHRHLEIYYATAGVGMVCHTVNPRLHVEQIAFIINNAQDTVLFYDRQFAGLVEQLRPQCPSVTQWVLLDEPDDAVADGLSVYANWLGSDDTGFEWPEFDENTACGLCYTSGTTGNPKGALYSHRSTLLHAYASCHPDAVGVSCRDAVMPLVPMYHVNAWGLPYSSLLSGAKLVMPGADLSGPALHKLCETEGVTLSAGVPSIWQILLEYVQAEGLGFSSLCRAIIGGSACPPAMITALAQLNVSVRHAWGMTEVSPLGTVCFLLPEHESLSEKEKLHVLASQGRPLFGAEFRIVSEGTVQPHDGVATGDLMIRGNWVIERYSGQAQTALNNGWFHTGDVASVDSHGYMRISDRSKDVIKSGGEWISSIEIENIASEHPDIKMAACIAKPDKKWGERPILVVVKRESSSPTAEDILSIYTDRVAKWMIPDEVIFIDNMPMTATGKVQKTALRKIFYESQEIHP